MLSQTSPAVTQRVFDRQVQPRRRGISPALAEPLCQKKVAWVWCSASSEYTTPSFALSVSLDDIVRGSSAAVSLLPRALMSL